MSATKYRKKPVVVEAFQMTRDRREDNSEWPYWLCFAWNKDRGEPGALFPTEKYADLDTERTLSIHTLEGDHLVSWGDYIIQGVDGELYPCKPEIFEKTYELAGAPRQDAMELAQEIKDEAFDPWCWNKEEKQYIGDFDIEAAAALVGQYGSAIRAEKEAWIKEALPWLKAYSDHLTSANMHGYNYDTLGITNLIARAEGETIMEAAK